MIIYIRVWEAEGSSKDKDCGRSVACMSEQQEASAQWSRMSERERNKRQAQEIMGMRVKYFQII